MKKAIRKFSQTTNAVIILAVGIIVPKFGVAKDRV